MTTSDQPTDPSSIDDLPLELFEGAEAAAAVQSLAECQWCDAPLPENAEACPVCGATVPDPDAHFPGLTEPYPGESRELRRMQAGPAAGTLAAGLAGASLGEVALEIIAELIGE